MRAIEQEAPTSKSLIKWWEHVTQETGKSFVEYLMTCRMERAMELAGTNAKMFCTATEVGIPDPNYFGRCFKKYTGVSYSEYVNSISSKN